MTNQTCCHPSPELLLQPHAVCAVPARDGYAAVPPTPRQGVGGDDSYTHVDFVFSRPSVLPSRNRNQSPAPVLTMEMPPPTLHPKPQKVFDSVIVARLLLLQRQNFRSCLLLQANQLRLTPVRQTRTAHTVCKLESVSNTNLYFQANARAECQPGPGQYHTESNSQIRKQDFRRPHDPVSCACFLLHSFCHSYALSA